MSKTKVVSKKAVPTKKVSVKKAKTSKVITEATWNEAWPLDRPTCIALVEHCKSIRDLLYTVFLRVGPENVHPDFAQAIALMYKPASKFNKWHLYFHRKNFRQAVLNDEIQMPALPAKKEKAAS